jgi:hypothetical protein
MSHGENLTRQHQSVFDTYAIHFLLQLSRLLGSVVEEVKVELFHFITVLPYF